ncbi:MAG: GH116 family glycosyl-hydrolase [Acidobacteriota bacterium]
MTLFKKSCPVLAMVLISAVLSAQPDKPGPDEWPVLKRYDQDHIQKIALPLGGIGTGTVSLGGRGNLMEWEIMNRPAKGFTPYTGQQLGPFFALTLSDAEGRTWTRVLEGPLPLSVYENSHGSTAINHGLPRFRHSSFAAAYPFGQVYLSDPGMPVDVRIEAFNPLVPGDPEASGIPVAVLRHVIQNKTNRLLRGAVCATLPNFIGSDGSESSRDWKGDPVVTGPKGNRNELREAANIIGIFMSSAGVDPKSERWGTIALSTPRGNPVSHRTAWLEEGWGTPILDFWDDFSGDARLEDRPAKAADMPLSSLAVEVEVAPLERRTVVFFLTWHFPNRQTWRPKEHPDDLIGNYYATRYRDAWDVAEKVGPALSDLERRTIEFVRAFCDSSYPDEVKEAALFNLSTLRSQTCFRTSDGRFCGFEGASNHSGCCWGSCTHVWNYEQATAFLFGALARSMREVEFGHATDPEGLMSFRVGLPLARATDFSRAAADGQMGCIMKMYRDWQLSADDRLLRSLWPKVRKALEFCWIPGGWDSDRDGVMEGAQHNTMDVEYFGPNPQMGIWYLGALRAAEEMASYLGEKDFARTCRGLFEKGKNWIDARLFNGEYYVHEVRPPKDLKAIAPGLLVGMGAKDPANPDYQLGNGCLVDQLVGQFMAHVCGLGYLIDPDHARTALRSILKYNQKSGFDDHFNCLRSFVLGDETALLMASYPRGRPNNPFPYFTEVMTGFEYTAAVGMLYEGDVEDGLRCIRNIRQRYDGAKRSPFDEAECGHHYARAMASWAAVLALSGFHYSGVEEKMILTPKSGNYFWSNGQSYGTLEVADAGEGSRRVRLRVLGGELRLKTFSLRDYGSAKLKKQDIGAGEAVELVVKMNGVRGQT